MRARVGKLIGAGLVLPMVVSLLVSIPALAKSGSVAGAQRPAAGAKAAGLRAKARARQEVTAAAAVSFDLCAKAGSVTMPDATVVDIWGFALKPAGVPCSDASVVAQLPGPVLDVNAGDVVTVKLHNELGEKVSLLLPGQDLLPDTVGAAAGGTKLYTFTASDPGTYLYESGANAARQVPMGLYGALIVRPLFPATLTTALTGADNDITYTAVTPGPGGNAITVAYVDPAADNAPLGVSVTGEAITVNLATNANVAASLTTALLGADNDITYTAVAPGAGGNAITVAYVDPGAADQPLSVGVAGNAIIVSLATDALGAITSTAADVAAAVNASLPAAALVTPALAEGSGTGAVTAMAATNLSGGVTRSITSTADDVVAAVNASGSASALVTAALAQASGAGLVTALAASNLTGGDLVAAYSDPATAYDKEAVLLLSEIDPALNADPNAFDLLNYDPRYWLINGKAYPETDDVLAGPGERVLLRYLNAGLQNHTMTLLGMHQQVIAKDAYPLAFPFDAVAETFPSGQTADMLVTIPPTLAAAALSYPLFERQLHVTNAGCFPGGMMTFVGGARGGSGGAGPGGCGLEAAPSAEEALPVNTSPPRITGLAEDDQTLTVSDGRWTGAEPLSFSYKWRRCQPGSAGSNCRLVPGATGQTYLLTPADVGHTIRAFVSASNVFGIRSATSNATPLVRAVAPANVSVPTISGIAQAGQTLTAVSGSWKGTPPLSFSYQWQRCDPAGEACSDIAGATNQSYAPGGSDVGATVRVVVRASNAAGLKSATSPPTGVVVAAPAVAEAAAEPAAQPAPAAPAAKKALKPKILKLKAKVRGHRVVVSARVANCSPCAAKLHMRIRGLWRTVSMRAGRGVLALPAGPAALAQYTGTVRNVPSGRWLYYVSVQDKGTGLKATSVRRKVRVP